MRDAAVACSAVTPAGCGSHTLQQARLVGYASPEPSGEAGHGGALKRHKRTGDTRGLTIDSGRVRVPSRAPRTHPHSRRTAPVGSLALKAAARAPPGGRRPQAPIYYIQLGNPTGPGLQVMAYLSLLLSVGAAAIGPASGPAGLCRRAAAPLLTRSPVSRAGEDQLQVHPVQNPLREGGGLAGWQAGQRPPPGRRHAFASAMWVPAPNPCVPAPLTGDGVCCEELRRRLCAEDR